MLLQQQERAIAVLLLGQNQIMPKRGLPWDDSEAACMRVAVRCCLQLRLSCHAAALRCCPLAWPLFSCRCAVHVAPSRPLLGDDLCTLEAQRGAHGRMLRCALGGAAFTLHTHFEVEHSVDLNSIACGLRITQSHNSMSDVMVHVAGPTWEATCLGKAGRRMTTLTILAAAAQTVCLRCTACLPTRPAILTPPPCHHRICTCGASARLGGRQRFAWTCSLNSWTCASLSRCEDPRCITEDAACAAAGPQAITTSSAFGEDVPTVPAHYFPEYICMPTPAAQPHTRPCAASSLPLSCT